MTGGSGEGSNTKGRTGDGQLCTGLLHNRLFLPRPDNTSRGRRPRRFTDLFLYFPGLTLMIVSAETAMSFEESKIQGNIAGSYTVPMDGKYGRLFRHQSNNENREQC